MVFDYKISTELGEIKTLEGTNKTFWAPEARERRSDPQETELDLPVFEDLLGSNGLTMACCGDRSLGNSCPRMAVKA